MNYLKANCVKIFTLSILLVASAFGLVDPAAAVAGALVLDTAPADLKTLNEAMQKAFSAMDENIKKVQDTAMKALEETRQEGTLHGKTNEKLTELGETGKKLSDDVKELRQRILDVEQAGVKKPGGGDAPKTAGQIIIDSDQFKAMMKSKGPNMDGVQVSRKSIINATLNNDQPLVQAERLGFVTPVQRRFTIRDLLPQLTTDSNLIEYPSENVFTNSAAPQGSGSSPDQTEGQAKAESNITFTLANSAVITLAHWIAASRQILSDAPALQSYIDSRLSYGLKLEEEDEILTSTGTGGELNGLVNQATAFAYGDTNQTALDTLLEAFLQVSLAFYESSGVVLHPVDWANIVKLKDTTNRYLFADPQSANRPAVWGKPVIATPAMTQGTFLTGAFDLAAAIYDREDMTIRISEHHNDFFVKNMVAILCEERLALVVYRAAALVKGNISHAG